MFTSAICPTQEVEAAVSGDIPSWLRGSLLRNGPAEFEVGPASFRHWFDGLAQIHRFTLHSKGVRYLGRPLQSDTRAADVHAGSVVVSEFGTFRSDDPCQNIFQRFFSQFKPSEAADNANISLVQFGPRVVALQERRDGREVVVDSLDSPAIVPLGAGISGQTSTAHPHYSKDGKVVYNLTTSFGPRSYYTFFTEPSHVGSAPAKQLATFPVPIRAINTALV